MNTNAIQQEFSFVQINDGPIEAVFPLLCPVREKDWIDGWNYTLVYSQSGLIEQGCVFTTPHHGVSETVWYVSNYNKANYEIEFIRVTPNEAVVKISIKLKQTNIPNKTEAHIKYQYTGLTDQQNDFIKNRLPEEFRKSMEYWERAINHYLKTGEKLVKH
jgi:hypothetical protein